MLSLKVLNIVYQVEIHKYKVPAIFSNFYFTDTKLRKNDSTSKNPV